MKRRQRHQPFGTPEQIWAARTGLQQSALRWLSVPAAERDGAQRPYIKTLRSLVYLRLAKWGPASRDSYLSPTGPVVTDPMRSLLEATLTELGESVVGVSLAKRPVEQCKRREQCAKCPWRVGSDPTQIPRGYSELMRRELERTVAEPGSTANLLAPIRTMACHDTPVGAEQPCVGWLMNQLGPGNNLALRLAVTFGRISADVELDGPQHETLQDTLPAPRRRR